MAKIINERVAKIELAIVPQRVLNAYPARQSEARYVPGDFVYHFAGMPNLKKQIGINEWLDCENQAGKLRRETGDRSKIIDRSGSFNSR